MSSVNISFYRKFSYIKIPYIITYVAGLLLLVMFYTLNYQVDMNSGEVKYRDNFFAKNEAGLFKPIKNTAIGNKFYTRYFENKEKEILFNKSSENIKNNFVNIFSSDYSGISVHDWYKEIQYAKVIKNSLSNREIPFHVNNLSKILKVKEDRFMGAPIWSLSPQVILLLFLSPLGFIFVNHLLLYTIGTYGLIKITSVYDLKYPAFLFLFLIFNFNGYMIEKFAAYGFGQLGYYFIPFVILYFIKMTEHVKNSQEHKEQVKNSIFLGVSLALIMWQGSLHLFVQLITFFIFWVVFNYSKLKYIFISCFVACILSAYKILPAAVAFGGAPNGYKATGYTDPLMIIKSFIYPTSQLTWPAFHWWELSLYISVFGFILLMKYSIVDPLLKFEYVHKRFNYKVYIPIFIMVILSLWKFSEYLIPDFIPLLNSESHPARYAIIPLLMLSVIATFNISKYIDAATLAKRMVLYLMLFFLVIFMIDHVLLWRLLKIQAEVNWLFSNPDASIFGLDIIAQKNGAMEHESNKLSIDNRYNDSYYIISFYLGSLISIFSLMYIFRMFYQEIYCSLKFNVSRYLNMFKQLKS